MAFNPSSNQNTRRVPRAREGERVTAARFNALVDAINQLRLGVAAPAQMRRMIGGSGAFDWAILRKVDVENKRIEVQRIKFSGDPPDSEEPHDVDSGCYQKLIAYGKVEEAYPPPGMTYSMFDCADAIRPVEEIPAEGEVLGWSIATLKFYREDHTIEFLDKFDASVEPVNPNDEAVSA